MEDSLLAALACATAAVPQLPASPAALEALRRLKDACAAQLQAIAGDDCDEMSFGGEEEEEEEEYMKPDDEEYHPGGHGLLKYVGVVWWEGRYWLEACGAETLRLSTRLRPRPVPACIRFEGVPSAMLGLRSYKTTFEVTGEDSLDAALRVIAEASIACDTVLGDRVLGSFTGRPNTAGKFTGLECIFLMDDSSACDTVLGDRVLGPSWSNAIAQAADAPAARPPLVLNMASPSSVGGGFCRGADGQEEELCRRSTLFCELVEATYPLPEHGGLVSPDVVVLRGGAPSYPELKDPYHVAVVTAAAPYKPDTSTDALAAEYEELMSAKIDGLLRTCASLGYRRLVLSAWGCGAFQNPPGVVARLFREALQAAPLGSVFDRVVFAVRDREWEANRPEFERAFADLLTA